MIFASFGNSPVPFLRMAKSLEDFAKQSGEEVVVQSGYTKYDYKSCSQIDFMDKETFYSHLQKCEVAVLQGGWGSISEASDMRVKIVAFPRRKGQEHHHDQIQLVKALENLGICLGCYDEKTLSRQIEKAKSFEFKQIKRGSASEIINSFIELL